VSPPEFGVVHLVRRPNGIEPFEGFIDSYRRHPAGAPHELVLVLKGFDDEDSSEPYRRYASGLTARWLRVADDGFDLGSYRRAAQELTYDHLLFLNSFSAILVDDWLALLADCVRAPGISAVAASGSWGSRASHMRYAQGLGGEYAHVFPDHETTHRVFSELAPESAQSASASVDSRDPPSLATQVAGRVEGLALVARELAWFAQFPSPHLRTNGLLIERTRWLQVCRAIPRDKLAAYRLESGRRGITARLRSGGWDVAVVGRDGRPYRSCFWHDSHTFWQGNQENLIIADNQTRSYADGDALRRQVLSAYAWGQKAAAALPADSPRRWA
jgi:hypothetical protein